MITHKRYAIFISFVNCRRFFFGSAFSICLDTRTKHRHNFSIARIIFASVSWLMAHGVVSKINVEAKRWRTIAKKNVIFDDPSAICNSSISRIIDLVFVSRRRPLWTQSLPFIYFSSFFLLFGNHIGSVVCGQRTISSRIFTFILISVIYGMMSRKNPFSAQAWCS